MSASAGTHHRGKRVSTSIPRWFILWTALLLTVLGLVILAQMAGLHPWSTVPLARVTFYHREECELVDIMGFLLQFQNFWSNFAYLAIGLLIAAHGSALGRVVGWTFVFLSVGSGWFHGTLSELGQTLDIAGVYCGLLAVAVFGFVELESMPPSAPLGWALMIGAIVLGFAAAFLRTQIPIFNSNLFTPILVGLVLVFGLFTAWKLASWNHELLWPGVFALVAGLGALLFKFTDGDDNLLAKYGGDYSQCSYAPSSLVQGHAIWHVLSAFMFLAMFEFFRSLTVRHPTVFPWR
jgi:hypothetical protein